MAFRNLITALEKVGVNKRGEHAMAPSYAHRLFIRAKPGNNPNVLSLEVSQYVEKNSSYYY